MDEDWGQHVKRVRDHHYLHCFALISIAVWAGAAFGWLAGIGTLAALVIVIPLTNTILLAKTGSSQATRYSRWGWLAAAIALIVALSVEIVHT